MARSEARSEEPTYVDFDRTLELPPEMLDDLDDLESATAGPAQPRQARKQTVAHPLSLDDDDDDDEEQQEQELRIARELASRRLSIARREQRHRHAIQLGEQRHRHEQRLQRGRQEARIVAGVLLLVVTSGLAWITLPDAEAAQIVFTTSFGAVAGYLGGRRGRDPDAAAS